MLAGRNGSVKGRSEQVKATLLWPYGRAPEANTSCGWRDQARRIPAMEVITEQSRLEDLVRGGDGYIYNEFEDGWWRQIQPGPLGRMRHARTGQDQLPQAPL